MLFAAHSAHFSRVSPNRLTKNHMRRNWLQTLFQAALQVIAATLMGLYCAASLGQTSGFTVHTRHSPANRALVEYERSAAQGNAKAERTLGDAYWDGKGVAQSFEKAFSWHKKAAEQGDAAAEVALGDSYECGCGVSQDYVRALNWYKKAAAQGDAEGEVGIGSSYAYGRGVTQDPARAFRWYKKAADRGNAEADNLLGVAYLSGKGVGTDYARAFAWFKKGADRGGSSAEWNLASAYENGAGVPRDFARAFIWWKKQADQGIAAAEVKVANAYQNGLGVPRDAAKAFAWYERAADQQDADGELQIGIAYWSGSGVRQDFAQALSWYEKAAAQGSVSAEDSLGHAYWAGQHIGRDYVQSLTWYRKAADQGDAVAQYSAGNFYWNGWGVPKDVAQAVIWYEKAAASGYTDAEVTLGHAYRLGRGVKRDYAQSFAWYKKAADQGSALGQLWVGYSYHLGHGVARDDAQSFAWIKKAAEQGNAVAEDVIGNHYLQGTGVPQDVARAAAWYQKAIAAGSEQAKIDLAELRRSNSSAGQAFQATGSDGSNSGSASESVADWQQEHQAKIDEITQEIANHERQAEQDDADAEQADAQVQQDQGATATGPGAGFLALGHAVQGAMNAGLGEKMRQDAAEERRQAAEGRQQLAELGAEQPPVAENDSTSIALTRMQTQMIRNGNTVQSAAEQQVQNIQALDQAQNEARERERRYEQGVGELQRSSVSVNSLSQSDQPTRQPRLAIGSQRTVGAGLGAAGTGAVPQGPATGAVTVIFRGLSSPVAGQAVVTETVNNQRCPPDCTFTFAPGAYTVHFFAQADSQSIFRAFDGNCVGGGGTAPRTVGNGGACALSDDPSQATTITVLVDPVSPGPTGSSGPTSLSSQQGVTQSGGGVARPGGGSGNSGSGEYTSPVAPSCIRMFNDPSMYGWISLQNVCSQQLTVSFVGKNGNGAVFGTMNLAPGGSGNTGRSPTEINAVGGIYWYPCPDAFVPTNMAGQVVITPVTEYTCKSRGY